MDTCIYSSLKQQGNLKLQAFKKPLRIQNFAGLEIILHTSPNVNFRKILKVGPRVYHLLGPIFRGPGFVLVFHRITLIIWEYCGQYSSRLLFYDYFSWYSNILSISPQTWPFIINLTFATRSNDFMIQILWKDLFHQQQCARKSWTVSYSIIWLKHALGGCD